MRPLTALIALLFIGVGLHSLLSFRSAFSYSQARKIVVPGAGSKGSAEGARLTSARITAAQVAASRYNPSVDALTLAARLLGDRAMATEVGAQRIGTFCSALALLGRAVRKEPFSSSVLLAWANYRQLLGSADCGESGTNGDVAETVHLAVQHAKVDPAALFAAALITLWDGHRSESLAYFKRALVTSRPLTAGQKATILDQIGTQEDLLALIPAKFPAIAEWSRLLLERDELLFKRLAPALSRLQHEAITASIDSYVSGAITREVQRGRFESIARFTADAGVRKRVDAIRADLARESEERDLTDFFRERSRLDTLEVLLASMPGDSRPKSTSIPRWGGNPITHLDSYYQSIGAYLAPNQAVRMIVLQSNNPKAAVHKGAISLFGSNDNAEWQEVSPTSVLTLVVDRFSIVSVTLNGESYRYWKIHFNGASRTRSFGNGLRELVQFYGLTARKGGQE